MISRTTLLALLSILTVGSTVVLTACASDTDDNASDPTDDEIKKGLGGLGAACSSVKKCKSTLTCKPHSSGPPPGAMGLPAPGTSGGPPPGAMGMPAPPGAGTCQTPADGEEGGKCSRLIPCHAGLDCDYSNSAPSSGPPPGAMGLPAPRIGVCKPHSGGPPPGAVGLPLPPNH